MPDAPKPITFPEGTPGVLQKICARTIQDLEVRKNAIPLERLKEDIKTAEKPRDFIHALRTMTATGTPALIAEVKKASPSKGLIREDFKPDHIASAYHAGGAACLSVLTDAPFFQGHPDYLAQAKATCPLPVLRKDFMLDTYQIYEARSWGADCILLIAAALDDDNMTRLYTLSKELGMDVLIEVHNQEELERALPLSPEMIGVNNRNLKTLEVDINTAHTLGKRIPDTCLKVAESGISSHREIQELQNAGYQAFLVGESLMRHEDIKTATQTLLGRK